MGKHTHNYHHLEEKLLLFSGQQVTSCVDDRGDDEKQLDKYSKWLSTFITACGNFSVQYNFQSISIALLIMSASQCTIDDEECKDGEQAEWVFSTASASVFVGAIMGQLTMGYAGDLLGRNVAMMITLGLVAISALASALVPSGGPTQVYISIIIARFFLGIGVGGVYPLSATKAAEDSGQNDDGHGNGEVNISAAAFAFFWQIPGSMTPWILANVFTYSNTSTGLKWRLLLGLGAVPAAAVVICTYAETRLRAQMATLETDRMERSGRISKGDIHFVSRHTHFRENIDLWKLFQKWDTWKKLIATGGGWFIYDIAYYGVSLFAGEIISAFSTTNDDSVSSKSAVSHVTSQNLIGLSMGIPACIFSILCLKYMSTKTLQVVGFLFIAFMFGIMATCFVPLKEKFSEVLFAMYCLLLFSLSFGPNLTTYVLPAQTFPKNIRATFNGISAACGKVGAFAGVYMFGSIAQATSYPTVMVICAVFSLLGAIISYVFIEFCPPSSSDDDNQNQEKEDLVTTQMLG